MPQVTSSDATLSYRQFGKHHEHTPVLGIMGFALDARFWAGQVPAVTQSHRFVTFDNRGVGRSSGSPVGSIADMAGDALAVLDDLGLKRVIVFGESMGGAIAQQLALDHPDRVEALILAVTWARPIEFMRRQGVFARFAVTQGDPEMLTQVSLLRMFTPDFFEMGQEAIDRMIESFTVDGGPDLPDEKVLLAQLDAIDAHDVLDRLGEISCPTLVLGGKQDTMVPAFASEEIAAAIPGARLQMFETGHACMIEEMDAFNSAVADFLATLP